MQLFVVSFTTSCINDKLFLEPSTVDDKTSREWRIVNTWSIFFIGDCCNRILFWNRINCFSLEHIVISLAKLGSERPF